MDQRLPHQQPPGLPLIGLVDRAVEFAGVPGPPVRVTLKQRKADTRAVLQHAALALVNPGERQGRKAGIPRRAVSQLQHGHIQPTIRHHPGHVRHSTVAGPDHPEPGRRLTRGLIAGAMLRGQHQPPADQVTGAELLAPIPQGRGYRDYPVHPDR